MQQTTTVSASLWTHFVQKLPVFDVTSALPCVHAQQPCPEKRKGSAGNESERGCRFMALPSFLSHNFKTDQAEKKIYGLTFRVFSWENGMSHYKERNPLSMFQAFVLALVSFQNYRSGNRDPAHKSFAQEDCLHFAQPNTKKYVHQFFLLTVPGLIRCTLMPVRLIGLRPSFEVKG